MTVARIIDGRLVTTAAPGPAVAPNLAALAAAVDAERDRRIAAGFVAHGHTFQSRPEDLDNIRDAYARAARAVATGAEVGDVDWFGDGVPFEWLAADNTVVPMDAHAVIEMGDAIGARKKALIFAGATLKARIRGGEAIPNIAADGLWPA